MSKIIAIIPARYQSSRFPGKPLAEICGKPMIQWVYERTKAVSEIEDVYVATDDKRIYEAVETFGGKAIMTSECSCGTDRVYQASIDLECDVVLNIQGDEPLIKPEMIKELIKIFEDDSVCMGTLKRRITDLNDLDNRNVAKVITNTNKDAIYFSRSIIPYNRDKREEVVYFRHIGVYGYTKSFLKKFVELPQTSLEIAEQLEQLRAIENGYKIRVAETEYSSVGVDIPDDIRLIERLMRGTNEFEL